MSSDELLSQGVLKTWYDVSTSSGEYKVYFGERKKDIDNSLKLFSIAGENDRQVRLGIIEDMLKYAADNNVERVAFRNSGGESEVIIDVLETK